MWAQAHEGFIPNTERTTFGNVPDHECRHEEYTDVTFCSVCLLGQVLPNSPITDCGHRHDVGVTFIEHWEQEVGLSCPAGSRLYRRNAMPIRGFTESEYLRDGVCTWDDPPPRTPKCTNSELQKSLLEEGYYVSNDEVTVNIGRNWGIRNYGPDDLTLEVRWLWSDFTANDNLPHTYTRNAPKVVGGISHLQGHRVFYDGQGRGEGPEIVYQPKRWAAGVDWFSYSYNQCEVFVTITFSDYKPVAERVSVRPKLDETRDADEWSWQESDIAHRHYSWDWKWKQDCDLESTPEHLCKLWFPIHEDVLDQWEYEKHGTVVTHRYQAGAYHVSGKGETTENLQNLSDDWDHDLWVDGGFLFSDPETGVLPGLDVSDAPNVTGYVVMVDMAGPAAWVVKSAPVNYSRDYSQYYDFGWTPEGELPIGEWTEPPGPKHKVSHSNYPEVSPVVIEDPPYSDMWRWESTSELSNRMMKHCTPTSGRVRINPDLAKKGAWICFLWRNKSHDKDFAKTAQHISVPYWVCDQRAEAYFADRAEARAAGFTAHDYCDRGVMEIGYAPSSPRLYPN